MYQRQNLSPRAKLLHFVRSGGPWSTHHGCSLYGLCERSCKWFTSYLSNRRQLVEIDGTRSDCISVPYGSPQGAILSPLLFTIFVADLPRWVRSSKISGYADDTCSYVSHRDLDQALVLLQEDAHNILKFMASNYLVANPSKTGLLVMRRGGHVDREAISIKIGSTEITESTSEKILGVTFSRDMSWSEHILGKGGVRNTVLQRLVLLQRLQRMLPRKYLIQVVEGLIMSTVRYGLPVFGKVRLVESEPVSGKFQPVQVVLNDIMRLLCGARRKDKTTIASLLQSTGLLSLNQMAAQAILLMAWKIMRGDCPALNSLVTPVTSNSSRISKSKVRGDLVLQRDGLRTTKDSFRHQAARIWNAAPSTIKNSKTIPTVKKHIREFVLTLPI